jgi:type IV pilus assembly protein PilB
MFGRRRPLGEMLIAANAITDVQLQEALTDQTANGGLLGEVLIRRSVVSEVVIRDTLSAQSRIPTLDVGEEPIPGVLLRLVPEEVCRRHRLVPVSADGSVLNLAMVNPFDIAALDLVRSSTSLIPFPAFATWSDVRGAIDRSFPPKR